MNIPKADLKKLFELHEQGKLCGVFITTNDDYHAAPGISNSLLGNLDEAPAIFKYNLQHPPAPTDPMEFGSACHVAILEPEEFPKRYHIAPPELDRKGTKKWEAECEANPGKHVLKALGSEGGDAVQSMAAAALRHSRSALLQGFKELSFWWKDPITGLLCKCRPDVLSMKETAIDYKTAVSVWPKRVWSKVMHERAYHRQGAMVVDGVALAVEQSGQKVDFPMPKEFVLYAQEKSPPYLVKPWYVGPYSMALGRRERDRLLALALECETKNKWPGYPEAVEAAEVPDYAFENEVENE